MRTMKVLCFLFFLSGWPVLQAGDSKAEQRGAAPLVDAWKAGFSDPFKKIKHSLQHDVDDMIEDVTKYVFVQTCNLLPVTSLNAKISCYLSAYLVGNLVGDYFGDRYEHWLFSRPPESMSIGFLELVRGVPSDSIEDATKISAFYLIHQNIYQKVAELINARIEVGIRSLPLSFRIQSGLILGVYLWTYFYRTAAIADSYTYWNDYGDSLGDSLGGSLGGSSIMTWGALATGFWGLRRVLR